MDASPTTSTSRRAGGSAPSRDARHSARRQQSSKLIDSLIDEALHADEPTRLSDAPPAPMRIRHVERRAAVTLPDLLEVDDCTDRMGSLPTVTVGEAWLDTEDLEEETSGVVIAPPRILCVTAPEPEEVLRSRQPIVRTGDSRSQAPISKVDTSLMTLSPALLDALKRTAPKPRRSTVPYLVGLVVGIFVGALAADGSTRGFVIETAQETASRIRM